MPPRDRGLAVVVLAAVLLAPALAPAFVLRDPQTRCLRALHVAAAKYLACEQEAIADYVAVLGFDPTKPLARCRAKYFATWPRLQRKSQGTGSTCDRPRFTVGSETVIDNLTALEWERKTQDGGMNDVGATWAWTDSDDGDDEDADGSVFTTFLATLNGTCFGGHCDWRLPSRAELPTIVREPGCSIPPCLDPAGCPSLPPCIDEATFGPTAVLDYWSATSYALVPSDVWGFSFGNGLVGTAPKDEFYQRPARAVRGGR